VVTVAPAAPVVIDSSALLAVLHAEPGGEEVAPLLTGAAMSAVNWSEVVQKALAHGVTTNPADLRADVEALGLDLHPFTPAQAEGAAALWSSTRHLGLSLGDRACLALAASLGATAVTADKAWEQLAVSIPVRLVR
jgi:PIN domain nuclease of toxin-antitoxin system